MGNYIKTFESFVETEGRLFWGTIAAGVIPICTTTKRILVGLRSDEVEEPGTWGSFGGKLDIDEGIDETIKEAVLRELEEETGYCGNIELVDAFVYKHGSFEYHNFFGLVSSEFEPELNWENESAEWFTYDELIVLSDKHFGLVSLLKNDGDLLKSFLK